MRVLVLGSATSIGFRALGIHRVTYGGGWVENLIKALTDNTVEIYSAFVIGELDKISYGTEEKIHFVGVPEFRGSLNARFNKFVDAFNEILDNIHPDVVHIIGTEREYDYALFKAFNNPKKTIVSITGLLTYYAYHFLGNIDRCILKRKTFGDIVRRWGPINEQKSFYVLSKYEKKLIQESEFIFGRTTWDNTCSYLLNPNLNYVHCGEIINPIYYTNNWEYENCDKHRIFVSQASYPIKGFHYLIQALPYILSKYPDTKVYVAGTNLFDSSFMGGLKRNTYANFLLKLLRKLNIDKNCIVFTGCLKPNEMLNQYLKANVAVLPSIIENSPNSLGEAMLLDVPCVASYVGGVPDMMEHNKSGYVYPSDEPYMLAKFILNIFDDINKSKEFSMYSRILSKKFFSKEDVVRTTVDTYKKLSIN